MFNSILKKHYDGGIEGLLGGAMSATPVGAIAGLAGSIIPQVLNMITAGKQRKEALRQQGIADNNFNQASDFANQGLTQAKGNYATAQNAYNGRMAGAASMEQNIYGNQANTLSAMGRNASNGAQLLALAGGVQGNTNNAFGGLATQEAQNKLYQQQMLDFANQGVMGALGNMQNLKSQQGMMHQQIASQTGAAGQINQANATNGLGNAGVMAGMGAFGNLGGLFQGGGNPGNASYAPNLLGYNPQMQQPQINLSLPQAKPFNLFG